MPTKKITPKLTIPVIPVCKFNEKDIKINMERVSRTLDTCNVLLKFILSESDIGSHIRNNIIIINIIANMILEPRILSLPYFILLEKLGNFSFKLFLFLE
tara:strand:+ start:20882 stop:21181 length:300 start_codon:yes stop_codon:yes gene_type:complete